MRRHVGRVDHVIWVVRPENLKRYADEAADLLGVEFEHMHGPTVSGRPREAYVSFDAGIEFMTPHAADDELAQDRLDFLERHGEGIWGIVFGVDSVAGAVASARAAGRPGGELRLHGFGPEARKKLMARWTTRVIDVQEAYVGSMAGSQLMFGEIEYTDE
ncbi:hypothetical protein L615_000300000740 [Nocardioides sp. J9]|uniref:VOC family protein n=1 Tax=Nocardioides sp. J9 TaxID=935844 RepID=UPI0011A38228|nr:VOC family protein [Nocardioides sp. J9]TWG98582.1 hypothetical protein L615_000300000740 [Nocardioides sp. J9]